MLLGSGGPFVVIRPCIGKRRAGVDGPIIRTADLRIYQCAPVRLRPSCQGLRSGEAKKSDAVTLADERRKPRRYATAANERRRSGRLSAEIGTRLEIATSKDRKVSGPATPVQTDRRWCRNGRRRSVLVNAAQCQWARDANVIQTAYPNTASAGAVDLPSSSVVVA
jgi:hypothetical protein